jgi:hypothetical protein
MAPDDRYLSPLNYGGFKGLAAPSIPFSHLNYLGGGEPLPRGLNCGACSLWARSPVVPMRAGPPREKTEPGRIEVSRAVNFHASPAER